MKRSVIITLYAVYALGVSCATGTSETRGGRGGGSADCVPEQCDGFDNDCDGFVDEDCACDDGNAQSCYAGPSITMDIGECHAGIQTCEGNSWGVCVSQIVPSPEQCDGLDNDCDGTTDENCGAGGGGGAYAQGQFADSPEPDFDVDMIQLPSRPGEAAMVQVEFRWQQTAGRPTPFDISVDLSGEDEALVQVFSARSRPFARVATRTEPIEPDELYYIRVARTDHTVTLALVRAEDDSVVLNGLPIEVSVSTSGAEPHLTVTNSPRIQLGPARALP